METRQRIGRPCRRSGSRPASLRGVIFGVLMLAGVYTGHLPASAGTPEPPPEDAELARLRAAVEKHPDSATAWRELGNHYYAYHHPEEALKAWRESLRLEPEQAAVRWSIGTVYSGQDDDQAAQHEYEAALAIDPDHTGALHNLGSIYRQQGRLGEAESLLKRAAELDITNFWPLGNVYADQGRWEEAVAAYERSQAHDGWSLYGVALLNADLGKAQFELGRDGDATRSLQESLDAFRSLERHPAVRGANSRRMAEVAYLLARVTARGGDPQKALGHLRLALVYHPELRDQAAVEDDLEAVRQLPEAADLDL